MRYTAASIFQRSILFNIDNISCFINYELPLDARWRGRSIFRAGTGASASLPADLSLPSFSSRHSGQAPYARRLTCTVQPGLGPSSGANVPFMKKWDINSQGIPVPGEEK